MTEIEEQFCEVYRVKFQRHYVYSSQDHKRCNPNDFILVENMPKKRQS